MRHRCGCSRKLDAVTDDNDVLRFHNRSEVSLGWMSDLCLSLLNVANSPLAHIWSYRAVSVPLISSQFAPSQKQLHLRPIALITLLMYVQYVCLYVSLPSHLQCLDLHYCGLLSVLL